MAFPRRSSRRRWSLRLGLLAFLLQLVAGALPMPAAAGDAAMPAWLAGSLCRGSDGAPIVPDHPVCPVCFVLSHAAGALPPGIAAVTPPLLAAVPSNLRDSAIASTSTERSLPPRGPPAAA